MMNNLELPIAHKLAQVLGGSVSIEYTNNSGTLVCFNFPN